ncbi:MAG: group II intron reverse transcriptase/maturase [Bacteroidota bacterium]
MKRGKYKSADNRQDEYSEPGGGCGLVRSSEEDSVTELERRDKHVQLISSSATSPGGTGGRRTDWYATKGLPLTLKHFADAYQKVKHNKGSHGVDGESLEDFELNLVDNLYVLWNRVSSGSYFPEAVREKSIPKIDGRVRKLGIPTIRDRIVQQVVKSYIEPRLDPIFSDSSWGYRPNRGTSGALAEVRSGVRKYAWVIDADIAAFFDNVSHEKLGLALDRHVREPWIRQLIYRWLNAPIHCEDGQLRYRQGRGTPQGGVISPLLANLYLHYALDVWMERSYPQVKFVRYADDVVIHCESYDQAMHLRNELSCRLKESDLELNKDKTRIVFCKRTNRRYKYKIVSFDFLGYTFKPRVKVRPDGMMFTGFDGGVSIKSERAFCQKLRASRFHRWTWRRIDEIAAYLNPIVAGWINYFSKMNRYLLRRAMKTLNTRLLKWLCKRYKRYGNSMRKAARFMRKLAQERPKLFYHWTKGYHTA